MEFSDWITKKYIEWRGEAVGHDRSITEFADWIGVSQSLMSQWMKKGGKIPRSQSAINKLILKFGNEVYLILGLPSPEDELLLSSVSSENALKIRNALIEINSTLQKEGAISEGRARELEQSIWEKHGIKFEETDTP